MPRLNRLSHAPYVLVVLVDARVEVTPAQQLVVLFVRANPLVNILEHGLRAYAILDVHHERRRGANALKFDQGRDRVVTEPLLNSDRLLEPL